MTDTRAKSGTGLVIWSQLGEPTLWNTSLMTEIEIQRLKETGWPFDSDPHDLSCPEAWWTGFSLSGRNKRRLIKRWPSFRSSAQPVKTQKARASSGPKRPIIAACTTLCSTSFRGSFPTRRRIASRSPSNGIGQSIWRTSLTT